MNSNTLIYTDNGLNKKSQKLEAWSLYAMGSTFRDFLVIKKEPGGRMNETTVFQLVFCGAF